MYVRDVVVKNQVGLHARPATFFTQKANEFKSTILLERENRSVKRIWKTWEGSRGSFMPKKTRARSMLLREYLAGS